VAVPVPLSVAGVEVEPDTGIEKVNAEVLSATFSSCKRLSKPRRFSFSTETPNDFASSSATFSSSCECQRYVAISIVVTTHVLHFGLSSLSESLLRSAVLLLAPSSLVLLLARLALAFVAYRLATAFAARRARGSVRLGRCVRAFVLVTGRRVRVGV
jgi:hypothetical protein